MHSAAQFLRGCANAHGRPLPSPIKNYPPRPPALAPRFIVKPSGGNNFALIKRATGKIIIERFGHNNATGHARALETQAKRSSVKLFGKLYAFGHYASK